MTTDPTSTEPETDPAEAARNAAEERARGLAIVERLAPELAARMRRQDDDLVQTQVRVAPPFVVVSLHESTGGTFASWEHEDFVFRETGERVLEVLFGGWDGQYVYPLETTPAVDTEPARAALRAAFPGDRLLTGTEPDLARARLFLSVTSRPLARPGAGVRLVGPLYTLPPVAVAGTPDDPTCTAGSPRDTTALTPGLLLPRSVLFRAGIPVPARLDDQADDDDEGEVYVSEMPFDPEPQLFRLEGIERCAERHVFGRYELRAHGMRGRNRGQAIVLVDRERGEHRWVLETRHAVIGTTVEWLGAVEAPDGGTVILGAYESRHGSELYAGRGGLVAIRARDGVTFRVDVPGVMERGRLRDPLDGHPFDACLDLRAAERDIEVDALPADVVAACRAATRTVELVGATLRVRRPEASWNAIDATALAALVARAR